MKLKQAKLVANAHLPCKSSSNTHEIFYTLEVKGAAMEASLSLREIPTEAFFKAIQSFTPSPQNPQKGFSFKSYIT
jgi:hypothetical protein